MRRLLLPLAVVALLAAPAAQAQDPAPPARATMQLKLQRVGKTDRAVTFTGKAFRVRGFVFPYVPGQKVRLRLVRGRTLLGEKTLRIRPLGDTGNGTFLTRFRTRFVGPVRVGATHLRTAEMSRAHARSAPVEVIRPHARSGERSHTVRVMQRLLRDAGYVVGRYGVLDARTARAVHAFRKLSGLPRTFSANRVVMRRLINGGGRFHVRFPQHGHHVEADLTHQVLALIDKGEVQRIYPMSSGAPATPTVLGSYRVYRQDLGTNSLGMVHSSYFIRGYAIHGFRSVPPYPASHGCLRVPVPDAYTIYRWVRMNDWVDTYYRGRAHRSTVPRDDAGP